MECHLNVFNKLTPAMDQILSSLPLLQLGEEVLQSRLPPDRSRGNKCIDVGFASSVSLKQRDDQGGVAMPNKLRRTGERIFTEAMIAMTSLCEEACQPALKGTVFVDPIRENLCARTIAPGNRIETLRVALTNGNTNVVDIHSDRHNCTLPNFAGVINYSKWLLLSDGHWWRLSLIGYSRKSIASFLRRRDLYMPLVERVCSSISHCRIPGGLFHQPFFNLVES